MRLQNIVYLFALATLMSCSSKLMYHPNTKLSVAKMQQDFTLMRNIYESEHPSLYWYSSKQYMDSCFDSGYTAIVDSMNEFAFKRIIAKTIANIKCGHTSVQSSKAYNKWATKANYSYIPLGMRTWKDTMAVSYTLYRKDTIIPRGSIVKSINGVSSANVLQKMFAYSSTDGNATNLKNIRVSGNFPLNYLIAFDSATQYTVSYIDTNGVEQNAVMNHFKLPPPDTTKRPKAPKVISPSSKPSKAEIRKRKILAIRNLAIDTVNSTATMLVSSFSGGRQKKFYNKSFKKLQKLNIKHLILDVRNNGGGFLSNSDALASYMLTKPATLADSVYCIRRHSKYNKYIKRRFWYGVANIFFTKKKAKNMYTFGILQRRVVKPKKRHHFGGNVYTIIGGYSFSATTVLLHYLQNEKKVVTIGEPTGGGAYGNSAIYIPDFTLPHSKLRLRLPLFRLVFHNQQNAKGQAINPQYYVPPNSTMLRLGQDNKIEKAKELIRNATKLE